MILFEVDPSTVHSGWAPLLLTLLLGAVVVLLWWSMRRQMNRIDLPDEEPGEAAGTRGSTASGVTPER